ncbi:SDR family NAD(P)-dependent oxidoreductase [Achromobacter xylosoxidans]|uniref:Glucose 1-dehydrogenase n=1 Tax=Alcaligenes xylosoxydans xylosoxydans TaxID=85698 RepID=A0A424WB31_ALCXX|nr:glucose 1-dehydrogenase [Achromobacter xylosoxidans]MBC9907158.1 glucose 1-dehydrogenase [Achromobacter xylosoxidans]MBD0870363.1 glucose 1-dehydrogenase [Achromobacter xylosoxidans]QNP85838.1 glucose 1-dehydrogenase [Achromobacter xylosoxidans]RPJ90539.1 glucose 1-dehydrogenase [Achromobacter xylosoxidans]
MSAATAGLLQGKLALVTGAGQGNGRALALGLAAAGARVVATDVQADNAMQTARAIIAAGGEAWSHALDVTDPEACTAIAAQVQLEVGPIDVLVNNAGILIREGIDSPRAAENWRRVLDVNLNGSFNMIHAFLGALRATRGVIINVGSIASFAGVGTTLGYSPSKGGVKMMTQAMARDLAPDGIRVNAIAPGVIETPMTQYTRDDPARLANFMQRIPLGRVGQPEDLVGPAVFLASPMAQYVTGVSLPVDGGYLAV